MTKGPSQETLRRWKHNSFLGHTEMARKNMLAILRSGTATADAKAIAQSILNCCEALRAALKERKK